MKEFLDIASVWSGLEARGEAAVLATVVGVGGSAYRRPGARMLLKRDGQRVGTVSGGCLEGDVARKAWWRTESGPVVVEYDTGAEDDATWGFGLGCRGVVRVLLERLDPNRGNAAFTFVRRCLAERRCGALARVVASAGDGTAIGTYLGLAETGRTEDDLRDPELAERLRDAAAAVLGTGRSARLVVEEGGVVEVFVELIRPPLPLLVCGAGFDAVPVVRFAKELGWQVTVVDPRGRPASRERFAAADAVLLGVAEVGRAVAGGGAAVLLTHNVADDLALLPSLLASPVRYLGILGPRSRTERLFADLAGQGWTADARVHGPVGLDVGAETPEQIALAIVAEVQAVFAGRTGGALCRQDGPIHDRHTDPTALPGKVALHPVCLAGAAS